jgi:EmrB/QacA subfamily drug resistance transporter
VSTTIPADTASAPAMSRRQVLEALSGLLVAMFVAMLASTVVSTSLPKIVSELGGDQAAFTWVITASLLATTVSTPIWGKLADLTSRKVLVQVAIVIFVIGTVLSGMSQDAGTLIGFRVIQGLGAGGLMALVQVVLSDIISPRERGRYMGLMGGIMAVATAGGPLLGGFITDTIGWRWNFYVAVPFAILALILIQVTLHLPKRRKKVRIDYFGAVLIAGGISLLLIWVTMGGNQFEWASATSWIMAVGAGVLLAAAVIVELKHPEPIIPLTLFKNRTFTLMVIASLSVGVAMFGTSVFISQYLQLSRDKTPTESGLYTLPQVVAMLIASMAVGALISRTGKWKRWMVLGAALLAVGTGLMSTIAYDTPFGLLFLYMGVLGLGVGMLMQNMVLVVQNTVDVSQMGAASASIAFFRSLGGAAGVAALGAALATRVKDGITDGLADLGIPAGSTGGGGALPELSTLPAPIRTVVEQAYGNGVGEIFLIALPITILTLIMVALLPNKKLGTRTGIEQLAEKEAELAVDVSTAEAGGNPVVDSVIEEAEDSAAPTAEDGAKDPAPVRG